MSSTSRSKSVPAPATARHWLLKADAGCFSFDDLWRAPGRRTGWDGVRNFQARNYLRDGVQIDDGVLFYHSNGDPSGIAGIARVVGAATPDPTQFDPDDEHHDPRSSRAAPLWFQVEIEAVAPLPHFLALAELRTAPELTSLLVLRPGQRLSVLPVTATEWAAVLRRGGLSELPARARGKRA
jgi:predicted RNA-binding protein with PUA-like domain